jgi:hypothetical protein
MGLVGRVFNMFLLLVRPFKILKSCGWAGSMFV